MTDKEKQNARIKFQRLVEAKHDMVLRKLLQDADFRFYMSELLGYCRTFENAFNEKGNVAAFQNGMQAVGQKIFNDIMLLSPESYIKMCKEENDLLALKDQPDEMFKRIGENHDNNG